MTSTETSSTSNNTDTVRVEFKVKKEEVTLQKVAAETSALLRSLMWISLYGYLAQLVVFVWMRLRDAPYIREVLIFLLTACRDYNPEPVSAAFCGLIGQHGWDDVYVLWLFHLTVGFLTILTVVVIIRGFSISVWIAGYKFYVTTILLSKILAILFGWVTMLWLAVLAWCSSGKTEMLAISADPLSGVVPEAAQPKSNPIPITGELKKSCIVVIRDSRDFVVAHGVRILDRAVFPRHVVDSAVLHVQRGEQLYITNYNGKTKAEWSKFWIIDQLSHSIDMVALEIPVQTWSVLAVSEAKTGHALKSAPIYVMFAGNPEENSENPKNVTLGRIVDPFRFAYFTHSCTTFPGCSGTPIFTGNNVVVGIHIGWDTVSKHNVALSLDSLLSIDGLSKREFIVNRKLEPTIIPQQDPVKAESIIFNFEVELDGRKIVARYVRGMTISQILLETAESNLIYFNNVWTGEWQMLAHLVMAQRLENKVYAEDVLARAFLPQWMYLISQALGDVLNSVYSQETREKFICHWINRKENFKLGFVKRVCNHQDDLPRWVNDRDYLLSLKTKNPWFSEVKPESYGAAERIFRDNWDEGPVDRDEEWEEKGKHNQGFERVTSMDDSEMRTDTHGTRSRRIAELNEKTNMDQLSRLRDMNLTDWNDIDEVELEGACAVKSAGLDPESTKPDGNGSKKGSTTLMASGPSLNGRSVTVAQQAPPTSASRANSSKEANPARSKPESQSEASKKPVESKATQDSELLGELLKEFKLLRADMAKAKQAPAPSTSSSPAQGPAPAEPSKKSKKKDPSSQQQGNKPQSSKDGPSQ